MANIKSAKKRIKSSARRRSINLFWKKRIHSQLKELMSLADKKDKNSIKNAYIVFQKLVDKASAKGVFHKNKASRIKSRVYKKLNAS